MSALADHVMDLQNVVVILFCLCCGSEDISENGSGWIWVKRTACFPRFVPEVRPSAGLVDVVPVRLNDNYRGPLWFCSPFQRAASNSLSCTENVPHHVFITTVIFPTNHKVSSLWRTTGCTRWLVDKSSLCPSAICFRFCLFISPSVSLSLSLPYSVYIQTSRSRGEPASEPSLHTTPFRHQISQDIQCTREFINTEFEPCLPSPIRVTSQGRTMPNTSPFFPLLSVPFRLALTVTLPPP